MEVAHTEVAEHASRKLHGVSMETVMRAWNNVGLLIAEKLREGKGAAIDRFGTFSLGGDHKPTFLLNADFASAYRVKQRRRPGPGSAPTTRLNYAKLASGVGVTREVARQIVDEVVLSLGTAIRKRGKVRLSFLPVAELYVEGGIAQMRWQEATSDNAVRDARHVHNLQDGSRHFIGGGASARGEGGRHGTTLLNQLGSFGRDVVRHDRDSGGAARREQAQAQARQPAHLRLRRGDCGVPDPRAREQGNSSRGSSRGSGRNSRGNVNVRQLMIKLRTKLKQAGGAGIVALGRKFRIMDDDGSKTLSPAEFRKAMSECDLGMGPSALQQVFAYFDKDGSGSIDYEEFLRGVRGSMNERRLGLVRQAFNQLDKDMSGFIDVRDIATCYDASKHPGVVAGRMTENQAFRQLLDSFDGAKKDGRVTPQEWEDYYSAVSCSIDNDDQFELMIRRAWQITGEVDAGLGAARGERPQAWAQERPQCRGGSGGHGAGRAGGFDARAWGSSDEVGARGGGSWAGAAEPAPSPTTAGDVGDHFQLALIDRVRKMIVKRGGENGIHTLRRVMTVMDSSGDGSLQKQELQYGLRDYGIKLTDGELDAVFKLFDRDGSGSVDLSEFLYAIRGELNASRLELVKRAFRKLDRSGDGKITLDDLRQCYDASTHPDVRSGQASPDDVFRRFLAQWDSSSGPQRGRGHGGTRDGEVTLDEFIDYYKSVSASIDSDDEFEVMMCRAWGLDKSGTGRGSDPSGTGSGGASSRRIVLTHSDGRQTVEELDGTMSVRAGTERAMRTKLRDSGYGSQVTLGGLGGSARNDAEARTEARARRSRTTRERQAAEGANRAEASRRAAKRTPPPFEPSTAWGDPDVPLPMDHMHVLRELLFRPPLPIELFAQKLGANRTTNSGQELSLKAFAKQLCRLNGTVPCPVLVSNQSHPPELAMLLARSLDSEQRGQINIAELHAALEARFGRSKDSIADTPLERLRARVLSKGGVFGIHALARVMRCVDEAGGGDDLHTLTKEELKFGLRDFGVPVSFQDLEHLFTFFDSDRSGTISFDEFLDGLRGPMSRARSRLVRAAFRKLDATRTGRVALAQMRAHYDPSLHPDVVSGAKSTKEVLRHFMSQWDAGATADGIIDAEEFDDFYANVSAAVDGDEYFERMMCAAWGLQRSKRSVSSAHATHWARLGPALELVTRTDGVQRVQLRGGSMPGSARGNEPLRGRPSSQAQRPQFDSDDEEAFDGQGVICEWNGGSTGSEIGRDRASRREERENASTRIKAAFRGMRSRKAVVQTRRKQMRSAEAQREADAEQRRYASRRVLRPALRATHGF